MFNSRIDKCSNRQNHVLTDLHCPNLDGHFSGRNRLGVALDWVHCFAQRFRQAHQEVQIGRDGPPHQMFISIVTATGHLINVY
jgi:hypothetical protein